MNENNLNYFNASYDQSRKAFRLKSEELRKKYHGAKNFKVKVESKIDNNLTIDFCFIPGVDKEKIFILSSGVHGVEGHVGSAVQLFFMNNYINENLLSKTSILLIHVVNPFGFKYGRRVTENNVDLNRNSGIDKELFQKENEGYQKVYDLINPRGKVKTGSLGDRLFFLKTIRSIVIESKAVLRQAILQGQYKYPKGLYYGGKNFDPQIKELVPIIDSICKPYQTILAIDLHTGFGERGKLHLFPNPVEDSVRDRIETVFEGFEIDWGDSDDFYTYSGDFVNFIGKINQNKKFIPMTFEYGTMNTQTTIGSVKSLHIMVHENQGEQNGYELEEDKRKGKKDFLEMYYPSSSEWRKQVIEQTKIVLDKSLKQFCVLKFK